MKVPQHIGIIMDGNRRWARERGLLAIKGHDVGADRVESIVEHAQKKDVGTLTFWAFSTENWKRNKLEVQALMKVFRNLLKGPMMQRFMKNGVKIQTIGDLSRFPKDIQGKVAEVVSESSNNNNIIVNFALNYGGREEILRAVNALVRDPIASLQGDISEETFSSYLYTAGQPDPDLIIRTGGAERLSGFLPWQSIYSELYFTDTYWPDFDEKEFDKALAEYAERERRFGK